MYHKRVNKNTAHNPVARAVARKILEESITDHKIKLYLSKKGDKCADECIAIGTAMSVLAFAAEMDERIGADDPMVRVVRGAISACHQMAEADSYDPVNTVAIDRGLDAAFELNRILKPELVTKAWNNLIKFSLAE
jgi:hypothetical protein